MREREAERERYGYEFFISVPPEVEIKTTAFFSLSRAVDLLEENKRKKNVFLLLTLC